MKSIVARLYGKEEGFTLIELLVVVAIIALLATFAVPKLFDAINKAKAAPGQADLQTISGALDRYYMENTAYPTSLDGLTTGSFLKSTTTFLNGYKHGYYYAHASDAATNGEAFILIDPQAVSTSVTALCGVTLTPAWDPTTVVKNGTFTKAQIDACTATTGMAIVKY